MKAAASRFSRLAACLLLVDAFASARAEGPTSPTAHATASETSAARDVDGPHPISDMVEELQKIQVRMATGDRTAYGLQNEKLRAIAAAIAAAKPDVWKKKSETDAAAAYVLGGGQPAVLTRLMASNAVPKSEDALLRGALAYAAGRGQDAIELLGQIDPRFVSLRLGAQLAYARSVLVTGKSPDQAIELLDLARLLAPGTLVEEAALRREILITGDRHYADRMIFLSRQYVSRFPQLDLRRDLHSRPRYRERALRIDRRHRQPAKIRDAARARYSRPKTRVPADDRARSDHQWKVRGRRRGRP